MDLSPFWIVVRLAFAAVLIHRIGLVIYRIYFHPLAKVPGPKIYAASKLPILYRFNIRGTWFRDSAAFHARYGPVVRTGPDEVSVDGSIGWKDIYSPRTGGKPEFTKYTKHYDSYYKDSILTAPTADHRRSRRLFAPAFTERAIRAQEPILQKYTSLLLQRLSESHSQLLDLHKWLNYTTFDITGELIFGTSFHCLEGGSLHGWIALIFDSIRFDTMSRLFREYPFLQLFLPLLVTPAQKAKFAQHAAITRERVHARLAEPADARQDIMTHLIPHFESGALSEPQLRVDAGVFVVAGSETSATALTAFFYHVCRHLAIYKEVTREIRSAFAAESEITPASAAKLELLNLCLKESMRLHPPAIELSGRRSPGAHVGGYWVPEGTEVTIPVYATNTNPGHFRDPFDFHPARFAAEGSRYFDERFRDDRLEVFEPFSVGPRDCIGRVLGWAQVRLIVARVLWRFEVSVEAGDRWGEMAGKRAWMTWEKGEGMMGKVWEREWEPGVENGTMNVVREEKEKLGEKKEVSEKISEVAVGEKELLV